MTRYYLRWPPKGSWHVLDYADDWGQHLRCGRTITPDIETGESAEGIPAIPLEQRSCETCLRLATADEDRR